VDRREGIILETKSLERIWNTMKAFDLGQDTSSIVVRRKSKRRSNRVVDWWFSWGRMREFLFNCPYFPDEHNTHEGEERLCNVGIPKK
jgi:hypothetical protein